MDGQGEAADRAYMHAAWGGGIGGMSSGRDQPEHVLQLEEEAFGLGEPGVRGETEEAERGARTGGAGAIPDEGRDSGDHGGEPGAKKNAFGLEDHGKMPAELQERVHEEVELTKRRSDWPVGKTLAALGVSRTTYYRWLREEAWAKAQAALETLPKNSEGKLLERPEIRSDNGSCYISREFGGVLDEYELTHRRIKPHCPEENGLMERANRTIDEALEGEKLTDYLQAVKVLARLIRWYNEDRLHSALGFLRPVDYYRGKPEELYAERRQKLVAARHRRRERNIQLRQPTLPLTNEETVA